MNCTIRFLFAAVLSAGFAGCGLEVTHVKPGQSARLAYEAEHTPAVRPALAVEMPSATGDTHVGTANPQAAGPLIPPPLPDINPEPGVPEANEVANKVADAYTRGSFAMQAGQNEEAIASLEEAVKLDPSFTDAWAKLVQLYERTGAHAKAADAYKKLKSLGLPNGGPGVGAPQGGGLGLLR